IWVQTSYLPRVHGSAIFSRGQTQCLSVVTLGSPADQQRIEGLNDMRTERFLLHYNFPHFSVGECGPNRGAGRREIGHGELAERSLRPMLPSEEEFPYTIRVVADIMESAGSTSMASVCAGSLSLFDAGVPMKAPVAGISIGLITRDGDVRDYKLLTDIYDEEDFTGDMDFKVAGTTKGITGIQCDMKVLGISQEIITGAMEAARKARLGILEEMAKELSSPRTQISENAPQMETLMINPMKIGAVIGPGGSVIREIEATAKAKLDINDDGKIVITSLDRKGLDTAKGMILNLTQELREGEIYDATVTSVKNFGMFVECLPGQEGLVHVTELSYDYVDNVESLYRKGDKVKVKCLGIDAQKRARLSVKALLEKPEGYVEPAEGSRSHGAEGGGSRDRGPRGPRGDREGGRRRPRYED
ncbi:MAG: polyribonucleotide nucleotidyltransferase, partial [Planctomycetota bacterium]